MLYVSDKAKEKILEINKTKNQGEDYFVRIIVVILSIGLFFITKKNLVYPTIFSAIILSLFNSYL